jgi:hypothetical protein
LTAHDNTDELRRGLEERGIEWERKGTDTTRWVHKGHVFIASVSEPSGEVILTTYPHTVADILAEAEG